MKATIAFLKKLVLLSLAIVPAMATSSFAYEAQTNNANGVFVTVTPKNQAQCQPGSRRRGDLPISGTHRRHPLDLRVDLGS
jgi:hypothetical protein